MRQFYAFVCAILCVLFLSACTKPQAPRITIENARIQLPAPGQTTAIGFLDIVNTGGADTLLRARASISPTIELHTHLHENGIMKMRKIERVSIAAKQTTAFKPRAHHLMIFDANIPKDTQMIELILEFEVSGPVSVKMKISAKKPRP